MKHGKQYKELKVNKPFVSMQQKCASSILCKVRLIIMQLEKLPVTASLSSALKLLSNMTRSLSNLMLQTCFLLYLIVLKINLGLLEIVLA